ncbi:hypothetical protein Tco_0542437 [Tanacetum coccineum]
MEDEEVPLVDGVFKGAFGALGDESAFLYLVMEVVEVEFGCHLEVRMEFEHEITIRRYSKSSKLGMISLIDYERSAHSKESNPIRHIDLARYGYRVLFLDTVNRRLKNMFSVWKFIFFIPYSLKTSFRREDQPPRSSIDHESIEDIV